LAIITTVLCCLPLGIVAIVNASKVNQLWGQGRYDEARVAAESAKKFALWGVIAGVVVIVLYFILYATGAMK
jgi:hypothetical protein